MSEIFDTRFIEKYGDVINVKSTDGDEVRPYVEPDADTVIVEDGLPQFAPEITGILREAYIDEHNRLCGFSIDHVQGWADGSPLRTSPIVAGYRLYQTQSGSFYLVAEK